MVSPNLREAWQFALCIPGSQPPGKDSKLPAKEKGHVDRPWRVRHMRRERPPWKNTKAPDTGVKPPFWSSRPALPWGPQLLPPPDCECRTDAKTDGQKNHPAEPCRPTVMCELIGNGCLVTRSLGVVCPTAISTAQPSSAPHLCISLPWPHFECSGSTSREPKMGEQKAERRRPGSKVTPCSHLVLLADRAPLLAPLRSTPHSQMAAYFPKALGGFPWMPSSIFHVPDFFSPFG